MRTAVEPTLETEALDEIERSLHGKLRARRLSEDFIRRYGEEALQRAVVEYLSAVESGCEIRNRDAFIVDAAFKRALDELRREVRRTEEVAVEKVLESGRVTAPATEEVALEHLRVDELRQAIETLTPEQRQVLSLYYFEGRSVIDSAHLLHLSENSFRRRLKKTLRVLRRRLGVELPERDSLPAIEIGLAAWTSIGGARVPIGSGPLEQAVAALASVRDSVARLLGGDGDKVTAVFGGPAGKVAGGCAGAAVACVLGGVVGPGVGGIVAGPDQPRRPDRPEGVVSVPRDARTNPAGSAPSAARPGEAPSSATVKREASRSERRTATKRAESRQLAAQTSASARVARESEASPASGQGSAATSAPEAVLVVPSEGSPAPAQTASESAQAEQQFGAFR